MSRFLNLPPNVGHFYRRCFECSHRWIVVGDMERNRYTPMTCERCGNMGRLMGSKTDKWYVLILGDD